MSDVFSAAKRSEVMSRIRGRGNKDTELALMRLFRLHGIAGWRRHQLLVGRPDFVFPKLKVAIFVDGCFWHGCPRHATWPKQNGDFWREKILRNKARDVRVSRSLRKAGWKVLRIWEHSLRTPHLVHSRILRALEMRRVPSQLEKLGATHNASTKPRRGRAKTSKSKKARNPRVDSEAMSEMPSE